MLIQSDFLPSGDLQLDAYSYSLEDLLKVEDTLSIAEIRSVYRELQRDSANRFGRRFVIPPRDIGRLQEVLEGVFQSDGQFDPSR